MLDEATAVRRVGEGRYQVLPDARFAIVAPGGAVPSAMNGGVMVATALRAVLDSSPHPYPVATSAHFLRVPRLEPAEVEVTWLKQGRTAATARATVVQDALAVLEVTVTTGSLPADPAANGELSWTGEPPRLPPIEECVNLGHWAGTIGPDGTAGYAAQVDLRLDPATIGWRRGQPAGIPEMRGYFRLREDRDPDAYMLALAVDGLPPVVFGLGAAGWAPTVELTWHMRAVPAPGPLRVATRCRHVSGGWFDEEAEVWDAPGRLVAQSRQIARVGRGASSAKTQALGGTTPL
ncbi:MAG TPA: thioesterase family protein [Streptosporangiaceae bacterium]|nr:thioesterase family protein [Streptosporangiaceae bacterium]